MMEIEIECEACGRTLDTRTTSTGCFKADPCEFCLGAAKDEAFENGRNDALREKEKMP